VLYNYVYRGTGRETGTTPGHTNTQGTHMIYTAQEHEWLSTPKKQKKRVSNQTADGQAPRHKDMRKHDWAITTTIEIDGVSYTMPVQV
jgi:hypothetical protein